MNMQRCFAILLYPDHTNSFVLCASVIACNHLMLYLREAARGPTSTEPLSFPLSRPTSDVIFTPHEPDVTYSYGGRSQMTPLRKHHAQNMGQKLDASPEQQPSSRPTLRVSLEMDETPPSHPSYPTDVHVSH